ncbi:MAG: hypothetical protein LBJ73_02245 [Rickettsiales bacterium]|nr:hypothetical protein [Rickettsiales bacterium]
MADKSTHKNYCENYDGTLDELAINIGEMTHQARAELFKSLADYVSNQQNDDLKRGRIKYARILKEIATMLESIVESESRAWDICQSRTKVISKDR